MKNLFKLSSQTHTLMTLGSLAFTAIVLLSGCGNVVPHPAAKPAIIPASGSANLSTQSTALSGGCTGKSNILPVSERYYDGSGSYEACAQAGDSYTVILHGKTHLSDTICVYPAQTDAQGNTKLLKDTAGNIKHQCIKVSLPSPSVKFESAIFNTFLIVESPDQNLMLQCLLSGTDVGCPWYSFGKFRD